MATPQNSRKPMWQRFLTKQIHQSSVFFKILSFEIAIFPQIQNKNDFGRLTRVFVWKSEVPSTTLADSQFRWLSQIEKKNYLPLRINLRFSPCHCCSLFRALFDRKSWYVQQTWANDHMSTTTTIIAGVPFFLLQ